MPQARQSPAGPPKETLDTLGSIGERVREARRKRGLSQEAVAGPWLSKSYISGIERNRIRPSLKALQLVADRLEIPLRDLLSEPAPMSEAPRASALAALTYQLDHASWLLASAQGCQALRLLNETEARYRDQFTELSLYTRYRFYLLRACAQLRLKNTSSAHDDLEVAMPLAQQLADGVEDVERVRNLRGLIYYEQDMPHQALDHHADCLRALHAGHIQDLALQLAIYTNVANDYRALGDLAGAARIFNELLELATGTTSLEQQAGNYWSLSLVSQAREDLDRARLYADQALAILEAARNLTATAEAQVSLADMAIARNDLEEAEQLLQEARQTLPYTGGGLIGSALYERYAALELKRGKLDAAEGYAQKSLTLGTVAYETRATLDAAAQSQVLRTLARTLRTVALVMEGQGRCAEAGTLLARALEVAETTEYVETISEIHFDYAELLRGRGDHAAAGDHYRQAYEHRQRRRGA